MVLKEEFKDEALLPDRSSLFNLLIISACIMFKNLDFMLLNIAQFFLSLIC